MSAARRWGVQAGLVALVALFPFLPGTDSLLRSAVQASHFTLVAASLVMLTGWVGQISLGHAALVGIGAYATGFATTVLGLDFPLSLPVAALAGGGVAALLGVVALRVRGLYLAVATLIFSWASSEFLFRQDWLLAYSSIDAQAVGTPGTWLHLDFSSTTTFYFVGWAVAIACLFGLTNLRDSKTGRAFFAVRGSEMAAASLGMDVLRYKALAFALSGALAGVAGNLLMVNARVVSPDAFDFNASLFFLAIAVVGGLSSLSGAVAAGLLFAAMEELFFQYEVLNAFLQLVSAGLLAVVFRLYPGGLAAMGRSVLSFGARAREAVREAPSKVHDVASRWGMPQTASTDGPASVDDATIDDVTGRLARGIRATIRAPLRVLARFVVRPIARVAVAATGGGRGSSKPRLEEPLQFDTIVTTERVHPADPVPAGRQALARRGDGSQPGELRVHRDDDHVATQSNGHRRPATRDEQGRPRLQVAGRSDGPQLTGPREDRRALIEAEHITVRFGGLTAVDDASLSVREGEIVGLIGPNGAGKTTLFNSIAGFNEPTEGRVHLYGQDVTKLGVHERAQYGLARTFQLIQLFPQLTVFENLLAATHLQNPTGFVQHMTVSGSALLAEHAARERVRKVISLLELDHVADTRISGIPFGTLRMIEVARCLVTGARVVMLDEPASGLDERETDRLTDVLRFVRDLGATLLLIEHDVRMVTSVSDYIYVLERGSIIADGTPQRIQSDPTVISAYLGEPAEKEAVS